MKVQETVACPKCGFGQATHETETLDGSEKLVCQRCAYVKQVIPEIDWDKSRLTEERARKLAEAGLYKEASELMGCGQDRPDLARTEVDRRLGGGLIVLKRNRFGQFVYRIEESGGAGSYLIRDTDTGQIEVGQLALDPEKRTEQLDRLKTLESFDRVVRVFAWEPEATNTDDSEAVLVTNNLASIKAGNGPLLEAV